MLSALREPRLLPDPAVAGMLAAPRLERLPGTVRGAVGWRADATSLLLHALLILLFVVELPDWLKRHQAEAPPAIEVTLVPMPPPAPAAPPTPVPPAQVPLASDASSEGPAKPKPAEHAEAAPAAPEAAPPAAPTRKPEPSPAPAPVAKAAPAEPHRAPTPVPRSALAPPRPAPAPANPERAAAESEPQTALAVPAPEIAPKPRGEQPAAPKSGAAQYTGFAVAAAVTPGGRDAAVYNAYLAAVRDKIAAQRHLLKPFYLSGGGVVMGLVIDRAGRLLDAGVMASSGSRALDHTVSQMVTLAAPFGPPPPEIDGARIALRFDLTLPSSAAEWDELMAPGKPG
jgi:TonB family protein